jgi:DNA adenine methylase
VQLFSFHKDRPTVKPFLRWAGGKTWLLRHSSTFFPRKIENYHEPFLGGGSVFLHLKQLDAIRGDSYLYDVNEELINAYKVLQEHYFDLYDILINCENNSEYYYYIHSSNPLNQIERAAKFIYLNRTSLAVV